MSSGRWFRAYDESLDDPKVQTLPDALFKAWFNLMCITSKHDGKPFDLAEVAFRLRVSPGKARSICDTLTERELLDKTEDGYVSHNWASRQYKSDVTDPTAPQRQKRYREKRKTVTAVTVTPTITVTPPRAEQNRNRAEQTRGVTETEVLEIKLRAAAGVENDPFPGLLVVGSISALIETGYSLDEDVIPTIAAKRATGFKPRSWSYYVEPIRDARAKRLKIIEKPAPQTANMDWPALAERYAKDQHWPPYAGPEPGMGGCKCPPEILEAQGIDAATGMPKFLKRQTA